jgi:hypothetical protein
MVDDVLKYKRKDGVDAALRTLAGDMFSDGAQSLDLRAALEDLDVPVLVIWGAQDQVIPASHAEGLPAGVEVHVLDGQGHSPHMEAANECNRLMSSAVDSEVVGVVPATPVLHPPPLAIAYHLVMRRGQATGVGCCKRCVARQADVPDHRVIRGLRKRWSAC